MNAKRSTGLASLAAALALASTAVASVPVGPIAASLPGQGNYGTIKGKLTWGGADAPPEKELVGKGQAAKDPQVCAKGAAIPDESLAVDPKTKGVRNGIAFLVKPQGTNPDAAKSLLQKEASVEIDQKNCTFVPFASAVMNGQKLVLKSSDPVNHNVRFGAFTNTFNQILPPNGETAVNVVPERRPIELKCDIHPWMTGYLMVFDHPFFAITKEDGSFEIQGVPPGPQKLVVWFSRVGYVTPGAAAGMAIDVKPGATTDVGAVKIDPSKVK